MKAFRYLMALAMICLLNASVQAAELHAALAVEGPADQQALQDLTDEFMAKNPGVKVTLEFLSWNPLKEKLVLSMAGGAAPDILTLGDGWEVEFAPMLLPLDNIVNKWDEFKDYVPSTLEASKYKGVLYGLPYRANPWITLYNAGHFLEAGLNPDRAPQTWEDVSQMAKKLVKVDGQGKITRAGAIHYGAAASYTYHAYTLRALMGQNNIDWAGLFDRKTLVNTAKAAATREAFDYYVSFVRNGWSAWTGNWTQFAVGNTSIMIAGQFSDIQGWRTQHTMNKEDARAALPVMKVRRAGPMPVDKWGISKSTQNPELAAKYLLFLSSRENLGRYLTAMGSVPARRSMGTLNYIKADREVQVFLESLAYGMPLPRSVFTTAVATALGKVGSDMMYKNTPFDTAVEEMITTISALNI